MEPTPTLNKDLILRENLAIERTLMANDRTVLSFIRTALYFAIAGLTLHQLVPQVVGAGATWLFFALAALLLGIGLYKYAVQLRKIKAYRRQVGNYQA